MKTLIKIGLSALAIHAITYYVVMELNPLNFTFDQRMAEAIIFAFTAFIIIGINNIKTN